MMISVPLLLERLGFFLEMLHLAIPGHPLSMKLGGLFELLFVCATIQAVLLPPGIDLLEHVSNKWCFSGMAGTKTKCQQYHNKAFDYLRGAIHFPPRMMLHSASAALLFTATASS